MREIMLMVPGILRTLALIPFLIGVASPVSRAQQPPLQLSDFITFILPEAGPKPEPHDPLAGLTGGGGSAVEQPTDALVYQDGKTTPFAGKEGIPGICEPGTIQAVELIDPEGKRPNRTMNIVNTHPNIMMPPQARLEEMQIISRCFDAEDKVYLVYLGTLRALPGQSAGTQ
jgi:hypothetical protein